MELDQLLAQLVERAQEVMGTQGRLRGLLRANQLIITDLALPSVLKHVVDAARDLVGAQYAALGVIAPDGGLTEFVHMGMPAVVVQKIGRLPQGKGLLGALIDDPRPIRLQRIADDPRSSGFPAGHPPMESFLGVPIEVRGEVFGNLYLAESHKGVFSDEDEELAKALAATAAVAIQNARLYEYARVRGEWLQASSAITRRLLSAEPLDDAPLRLIAERSREISGADVVVVVLPLPDGAGLTVEAAVGAEAQGLEGRIVPMDGSVSGRVFADGTPLRVDSPEEVGLSLMAAGDLDVGPAMMIPLLGSTRVRGVLGAFRRRGKAAFTGEELDMASGFANHAAVAIELSEARAEQARGVMLDDRERIAADLHDHVIQKLFAAGLSLQTVAARIGTGTVADRVSHVVDDLDDTISQIRTTIFQLQRTSPNAATTMRGRLLDVVGEARQVLGFDPGLRFSGLIDTLRGQVADDAVAVLREALSNVARHARASSTEVSVRVGDGKLVLEVVDDGAGLDGETAGSGLSNLRQRAHHHDGSLTVSNRKPSGTILRWAVPLS
jgi:signal transduction histidine kinase